MPHSARGAVVQDFGQVSGDVLRATQQDFAKDPDARHRLLMLRLRPDAQQGQKDDLNQVGGSCWSACLELAFKT